MNLDPCGEEPRPDPSPASLPAIVRRGGPPALAKGRATASAPDILALVKILKRVWLLALVAGTVCAAIAGGVVWSILPPATYTASATLLVATYRPKVIFDTSEKNPDYRTFQKTQENLIKSRQVMKAALMRPEIARLATVIKKDDPYDWIEKDLKVEFLGGSEMLRISLSGEHARDITDVVNAMVASYLTKVGEMDRENRLSRFEKLQKLYGEYQVQMENMRKRIREKAEKVGTDDKTTLAYQHQLELERLGRARQEYADLKSRLREARSEVEFLNEKLAAETVGSSGQQEFAKMLEADPTYQEFLQASEEFRQQFKNAERRARQKTDPSLIQIKNRLDLNEKRMSEHLARLKQTASASLLERGKLERADADRRLAILKKQSDEVQKEIEELTVGAKEMGKDTMDLHQQQSDLELKDDRAKKVGAEVNALEIEVQAAPRIIPMDPAEVPKTRDQGKAIKLSIGAALATFAAIVFAISFWEFRTRKITTLDEVVHDLGIPLMGTLPTAPANIKRTSTLALPNGNQNLWKGHLLESIDAIRTMLVHAARTDGLRVVMVTSALSKEGKTSLACHLSGSLARAGWRTLLVDCDLRIPTVHRLFEIEATPGVSEYLAGQTTLTDAIVPTPAANLWIMPAGECNEFALQGLAREGLRPAFEEMKGSFDFIIIDSAPVLPVVDSLLVGQQVDSVILSIRNEVSRFPTVQSAFQKLSHLNIPILGAVVLGEGDAAMGYAYNYNSQYVRQSHRGV